MGIKSSRYPERHDTPEAYSAQRIAASKSKTMGRQILEAGGIAALMNADARIPASYVRSYVEEDQDLDRDYDDQDPYNYLR